jgi:hypothetical protein
MSNNNKALGAVSVIVLAILAISTASEYGVFRSVNITGPGEARPETLGGTPAVAVTRAPLEWAQSKKYDAQGPSQVYMLEVPVGVYDPHNKLAKGWGQDGEAKRMTKRITAEEAQRLREDAMKMEPNLRVQSAVTASAQSKAPESGVSFDSLDVNDCCGGGASVPPDPELAVGPNHIIAVVNVAFEIYDKTGALLVGPITFSSFFNGVPGCTSAAVFDPNVLYDEEADRFILGVDGGGTDYCVAATTGSDPLGAWRRYGFPTDFGGAFFDYPHAGVGVDAIYMGSNQFGGSVGFEGRVFAMDKVALYNGLALSVVSHSTGNDGTPQPMNLHGFNAGTWPTSGPHFIMTEVFDGATHTVWSWTDPFGSNTFVVQGDLDLNVATGVVAGFPLDVPQSGGADIQGNDWRGLDTEYRNGSIWMTNTQSCNPGSGTVNCIRWAQIDPTVPAVLDAGVFASNGEYRIFPDLAVNKCEDMAIGYSKSSASMFPGIWVTGRENTDPAGLLQAETELKAGEIAYFAFDGAPRRWGDYTGMTIDPDGETFWYIGEYSKDAGNPNARWGTHIGSYSFASCGGVVPPGFTLTPPVPATGGVVNSWSASGAGANSRMLLILGRPGTTTLTIPGCATPVTLDVSSRVNVRGRADVNGDATFSVNIPSRLSGRRIVSQAVSQEICEASNVLTTSFN